MQGGKNKFILDDSPFKFCFAVQDKVCPGVAQVLFSPHDPTEA